MFDHILNECASAIPSQTNLVNDKIWKLNIFHENIRRESGKMAIYNDSILFAHRVSKDMLTNYSPFCLFYTNILA